VNRRAILKFAPLLLGSLALGCNGSRSDLPEAVLEVRGMT
jgi:hypothetical protein